MCAQRVFLIAMALIAIAAHASSSSPSIVARVLPDPWLRPSTVPDTEGNESNEARIFPGSALFFDTWLSVLEMLRCAFCHNPARAWSYGQPTAVGHRFEHLPLKTTTILNAAYNALQRLDGRKTTLEYQALGPISSAEGSNLPLDQMVARLRTILSFTPSKSNAKAGASYWHP